MKKFIVLVAVATALLIGFAHALAEGVDVTPNKEAVVVDGRPLTAVVVTQCNGLLAVYMTMPDGRLLRFDKSSGLPWSKLLQAASTAVRSERIEVSCEGLGVKGYEEGPRT